MQPGNDRAHIIKVLNDVLGAELTEINQLFVHAKLCHHWRYDRLEAAIRAHSVDEMRITQRLIDRIIFLEGKPDVSRLGSVRIGRTVPEIFALDLALEVQAVEHLNDGIDACQDASDNGSRLILESALASVEAHVEWLEAQLAQITQVGEANYLEQQIRAGDVAL